MKLDTITTSRWMAITPLVLALILTISYAYVQWAVMECDRPGIVRCEPFSIRQGLGEAAIDQSIAVPSEADYLRRGNARVTLKFFIWADVVTMLLAAIGFLIVVWDVLGRLGLLSTLIASVLIAIPAISLDRMFVLGGLAASSIQPGVGGITNFVDLCHWLNSANYYVTAVMVLALCAICFGHPLSRFDGSERKDRRTVLEVLSEQRKCLSFILYAGTTLLVVGVMRLNSSFDFARSFFPLTTPDSLSKFFGTISTDLGAYYSLMLAATYIPTAFVLQKRAEKAFARAHPGEDPSAGLTKLGFNFSIKDALPRILAIAGPLLTGTIADALTRAFPK